MNNVKEIQRLNAREAQLSTSHSQTGSWHEQYKDSAHVFVGGLPYHLTEGDIICVVSQFGEVAGINLVRDKETGKSKGYAFLKYVDQRSTILAVDNLNGAQIAGRTIRVDHVQNYKVPKVFDADGNEVEPDEDTVNNVAPKPIQEEDSEGDDESSESEVDDTGIDIDDPMREYLLKKRKKEARKAKRKADKESGKTRSAETKAERKARKELKKAAKREKEGNNNNKSKSKSKDDKDSSTPPPHPKSSGASHDEKAGKGGDPTEIDIGKEHADKITERSTTNKDKTTGSLPPPSSSRQGRPRSRSRSPRHRSRSRSPHYRSGPRSNDRYRDRDDYSSSRRRRDDSRDRRQDDSRDRYASSRRRSPTADHGRHRGYDRDRDRGSRYRSRSRSPRRGSRRSRTRSPESP
ncbi:hypothetical protein BGX23_005681 [Mortierella sp. AD031]|nr:hypothetical protein BGX23_005681 [Mortierella sp. AD031]